MKIVVTGGAGFIGSHLASDWVARADVTVLDDLSHGSPANVPEGATLVRGSILDEALLRSTLEDATFVFHEAGMPSVPRSVADPLRSHEVNATGTLRVLEAARRADVEKVVLAASSSAYGDTPTLPKVESMAGRPLSPYAVAKLAGEQYGQVYNSLYGLRTTSVRYFNVYGPGQDPRGEYAAVICRFINAAIHGHDLTIFGDGLQTRDFTFVKDAVLATNLAAETREADGEILNAGTGGKTSINELAEKIIRLTASSSKIVHVAARAGDIRHSIASIEKASRLTGYRPRFTIDEGLKATVEWFSGPLTASTQRTSP